MKLIKIKIMIHLAINLLMTSNPCLSLMDLQLLQGNKPSSYFNKWIMRMNKALESNKKVYLRTYI